MLELMSGLPVGVVGARATGRVTADDYHDLLDPALDAAMKAKGAIRILYVLGPEPLTYTAGAMAADTGEWIHLGGRCERMAVVTDIGWIRDAVGLFRHAMPSLRLYAMAELDAAQAWVAAP